MDISQKQIVCVNNDTNELSQVGKDSEEAILKIPGLFSGQLMTSLRVNLTPHTPEPYGWEDWLLVHHDCS